MPDFKKKYFEGIFLKEYQEEKKSRTLSQGRWWERENKGEAKEYSFSSQLLCDSYFNSVT